jgi:hypothetical protein
MPRNMKELFLDWVHLRDKCVLEEDHLIYLDLDQDGQYRRANGDWAIYDLETKKLIATNKGVVE